MTGRQEADVTVCGSAPETEESRERRRVFNGSRVIQCCR